MLASAAVCHTVVSFTTAAAGLPPELLRLVLQALGPDLQQWACLQRVCRSWRAAATLDLVQHARVTAFGNSGWSLHRAELSGLQKLELTAPAFLGPARAAVAHDCQRPGQGPET